MQALILQLKQGRLIWERWPKMIMLLTRAHVAQILLHTCIAEYTYMARFMHVLTDQVHDKQTEHVLLLTD